MLFPHVVFSVPFIPVGCGWSEHETKMGSVSLLSCDDIYLESFI